MPTHLWSVALEQHLGRHVVGCAQDLVKHLARLRTAACGAYGSMMLDSSYSSYLGSHAGFWRCGLEDGVHNERQESACEPPRRNLLLRCTHTQKLAEVVGDQSGHGPHLEGRRDAEVGGLELRVGGLVGEEEVLGLEVPAVGETVPTHAIGCGHTTLRCRYVTQRNDNVNGARGHSPRYQATFAPTFHRPL